MNDTKMNTSREAAVTLMEAVVRRWIATGQPLEPLAEVLVSVAVDLHVRELGERSAGSFFRAIGDQIHPDDGARFDA